MSKKAFYFILFLHFKKYFYQKNEKKNNTGKICKSIFFFIFKKNNFKDFNITAVSL